MTHAATLQAVIITAGGQARRYGADKVLARLGGQTLLERVALSLPSAPLRLIVSAKAQHQLPGWHTLPDLRPGQGPLAGLETGLSECQRQGLTGWVAFCAADMPHLTPQFWQVLRCAAPPGVQAISGLDQTGRQQPLAALYHTSSLSSVHQLLGQQRRRMSDLLSQLHTLEVPYAAIEPVAPQAFHNVNTPQDLR